MVASPSALRIYPILPLTVEADQSAAKPAQHALTRPRPPVSVRGRVLSAAPCTRGAVQTMPEMITDSGLIVGCFDPRRGRNRFARPPWPVRDNQGFGGGCKEPHPGLRPGRERRRRPSRLRGHSAPFPLRSTNAGVIVGQYWVRSRQYGFILKAGKLATVRDAAAAKAAVDTLLTGIADNDAAKRCLRDRQGSRAQLPVPRRGSSRRSPCRALLSRPARAPSRTAYPSTAAWS